MSKLLIDENPLIIIPKLATLIGLNEAIVLQQIHYWLQINQKAKINLHNGHYWTYNSLNKWSEQFPFWSSKTLQRTIDNLEKGVPLSWPKEKRVKLLIVGNYNKMKIDRTKWYRIDYEALKSLETSPIGQNDQMDMTNCPDGYGQNDLTNTRDYTENNTENNNVTFGDDISPSTILVLDTYLNVYMCITKKEHPHLKSDQRYKIYKVIKESVAEYNFTLTDWKKMINKHFATNYGKDVDFNANHFFTKGIIKNRMLEECL